MVGTELWSYIFTHDKGFINNDALLGFGMRLTCSINVAFNPKFYNRRIQILDSIYFLSMSLQKVLEELSKWDDLIALCHYAGYRPVRTVA